MVDRKRCFVIMPFSKTEHHSEEYWKRHFTSYLKPLIEKTGQIEAFRSQPLRGDVSSQIVTDLINSDIVVADLTDYNPNVFWELGVRQSYAHSSITIAELGTEIPFHLSHKGILFYNGDHLDNQRFEDDLLTFLGDCLANPNEPDSPVLVALGGRGSLYSIFHAEENKRKIQALQMELDTNEALSALINERCLRNDALKAEGKPKERQILTALLKTSAAEFLYINRYLDLNEDFYLHLNDYFNFIIAVNRNLELWSVHSDEVNAWLLSHRAEFVERISQIREEIKKV